MSDITFTISDNHDGSKFIRSIPTLSNLVEKKDGGDLTRAEFVALHLWMKCRAMNSDDPQIKELS